jgi:hypothetical protein
MSRLAIANTPVVRSFISSEVQPLQLLRLPLQAFREISCRKITHKRKNTHITNYNLFQLP